MAMYHGRKRISQITQHKTNPRLTFNPPTVSFCKNYVSFFRFCWSSWATVVFFQTDNLGFPSHTMLSMLAILAQADITSESVANGFALEIVPSKRASGKIIRRFRTGVFSSRATRLQTSTVLSDFWAFNRSTSCPSNPTHLSMTPASSSRRKSTCTTRTLTRKVLKSFV